MKSWKTTTLGIVCFVFCGLSIADNLQREAYALRYYQGAAALLCTGLGLLCARDHTHKEK